MKRYEQAISLLLLFIMACIIAWGLRSMNGKSNQDSLLTGGENAIVAEQ